MFAKRTDLALESHSLYQAGRGREPAGVDVEVFTQEGVEVTRIVIRNTRGARALGKPVGAYITASLGRDWMQGPQWIAPTARILAGHLASLLPKSGPVLVCGLGNRGITPDNLGPCAVAHVIITRHLLEAMPQELPGMRPVCAISTGVLGLTGIETAEIVKGVCDRVQPCAVIAVDALAAMEQDRLCRTFQISDTGIVPGSGASNSRHALGHRQLGVPVIAMGMPTVIDSATLMANLLERNGIPVKPPIVGGGMLVTPKDIDALIQKSAKVIGYAINLALQGDMTVDEMEQMLM